jgi:hypothetical protein
LVFSYITENIMAHLPIKYLGILLARITCNIDAKFDSMAERESNTTWRQPDSVGEVCEGRGGHGGGLGIYNRGRVAWGINGKGI